MRSFLAASLVVLAGCGTASGFDNPGTGTDAGIALGDGGGIAFDKDAACATNVEPTTRAPGGVVLVVDQSFSMSQDPDGNTAKLPGDAKWDVAQPALIDLVKGLPAGLDLGLELFPSAIGCSVASSPQVGLGDINGTRSSVISTLSGAGPVGDTPTTPALNTAYKALGGASGLGAKVVVFLSDGEPNCGSTESSVQIAVGDALKKFGIKTYVIGVPGSPYTAFSKLAVAGGTRRDPKCLEVCDASWSDIDKCCHYVTSASDFKKSLTQALGEIAAQLKTNCVYKVPHPKTGFDPGLINVVVSVDGKTEIIIGQSADPNADGWSYTDGTYDYVILHGKLCTDVLAWQSSRVEVVVGCPTQVK
ncbi:hypothetical protein BH09MYX1_BH09MYX1_37770 [soil metagenome]